MSGKCPPPLSLIRGEGPEVHVTSMFPSSQIHVRMNATEKFLKKMGFRIGRTIGKGTYSKVCLAVDENGTKHACKIIKKHLAGSDFIDKFLPREIEIVTSIKHPNIVQIHKIFESKDVIYMLMDYCRLGDLLEYIKDYGALPEKKAKLYFKQVVGAVSYLHDLDIAHRDLKCENIFLMWNNQIKVGDFGFARTCTDFWGTKIMSDTFCGSAAYAAPEILKGIPYDPKMYDIWALGCILYVIVTSSMPFDDIDLRKMIKSQMDRSIFTLTLSDSPQLKNLVHSLLEPDLNKRATIDQIENHPWFLEAEPPLRFKKLLSLSDTSLCPNN